MQDLPLFKTIKLPAIEYDSLKNVFIKSSKQAQALLQELLVYRPSRRISAKMALQHAYFGEMPLSCSPALLPTFPELRNEHRAASMTADTASDLEPAMKKQKR